MIETKWYFEEALKILHILRIQNNVPWKYILLKMQEMIEELVPKVVNND